MADQEGSSLTQEGCSSSSTDLTQEEAERLVQAHAEKERYEFKVVARHLCEHHRVSDPHKIAPFGDRPEAWQVMREVTLGVEVGSVIKKGLDGEGTTPTPPLFQFDVSDPSANPEAQCVQCPLDNKEWCQFLGSPLPLEPFKHPRTGTPMASDLDRVYVHSIVTRHVWSSVPISVAGRLNYYHTGVNETQQSEEQDRVFEAAGGIRGACISIDATPQEGKDVDCSPMPKLAFGYSNQYFTATMAHITDANLMTGIVEIPHAVCVEARLPVFRGVPEPSEDILSRALKGMSLEEAQQKRTLVVDQFKAQWEERAPPESRVQCFYAIPVNHVLAWALRSEDYVMRHNLRVERFQFYPPPGNEAGLPHDQRVLLYFLLNDVTFRDIVINFRAVMMHPRAVDVRPLSSIAFEFLPMLSKPPVTPLPPGTKRVQGVLSMRSFLSYYVAPRLSEAQVASLAPTLHPLFPACDAFIQ
jgi:hypothetical protein